MARNMTDQGIKLIMFQGQSEDWVYLYIDPEGKAQLLDASEYVGMNTYPIGHALREKYNDRIAVAAIGTAGTLECYRPEAVYVYAGGRRRRAPEAWIALLPGRLPGGTQALLPPEVFP